MMRYSFTLTALLLLLGATTNNNNVQAETADYAALLSEVSGCFTDDSADATATLTCLSEYTDCFDSNSVTTVETCIQNANSTATSSGTNITTEIQNCLSSYVTCITTEFQEIIDSLPACMNTTITALGQCYIDNADTCNSTCSADDIPKSNPYSSVSATSILVCQAFQSDIMDPTCAIVDCCSPCISKFESFMNCIAQDALNLKVAPPQSGDCTVSCSSSRRLGHGHPLDFMETIVEDSYHRMLASHAASKLKAEEIFGLCAKFLETATVAASNGGSSGQTPPAVPAELAANIVKGTFHKCVVEKLDQLTSEYATSSPGKSAAMNNGGSFFALAFFTTMVAVVGSVLA